MVLPIDAGILRSTEGVAVCVTVGLLLDQYGAVGAVTKMAAYPTDSVHWDSPQR